MPGQNIPWASPDATNPQDEGVTNALLLVEEAQSKIPGWTTTLTRVAAEVNAPQPDPARLRLWLAVGNPPPPPPPPQQLAAQFAARDAASEAAPQEALHQLTVRALLGEHAGLVIDHLGNAAAEWGLAATRIDGLPGTKQALIDDTANASAELASALQHALLLTFLAEARSLNVGQQREFTEHCKGWGLNSAQIDETWGWLTTDMPAFGGQELPLVLDTTARAAYKTEPSSRARWLLALMPLWGLIGVYGIVALLFALLRAADVKNWPSPDPGWKLLVLLVFVVLGASLHVGSRWINVNYDNPIKVYDAGGIINWLSLRWLGVLQYYLPVVFVVASPWGAGNVPDKFAQLGAALLAGYSADSAFGAAVSKLQSQAPNKPVAAPAGPAAPAVHAP